MSRRREDEKHENFRPAPFKLLLLRMCSPLLLSDSLSLPADLEARFQVMVAVDSAGWTGANGAPKKVPTFTSPPPEVPREYPGKYPPTAPLKDPEKVSHSSKSGRTDTIEALFKGIFRVLFFLVFSGISLGVLGCISGGIFRKTILRIFQIELVDSLSDQDVVLPAP